MTADKILVNNYKKFNLWNKQLEEHYKSMYDSKTVSKQENERIFYQTNDLLIAIADNFFQYGQFKDNWDTSKCQLNPMGQNLLLKSNKMDITFQWGLDEDYFFLESYFRFPENLRYMKDDFWSMLLELKTCGIFEYTGADFLNKKERPFFENKTSTVFQLIRNFMLFQTEKMEGKNYQQSSSMDIGQFILKWDVRSEWPELLEKTCKAFKLLYNLNYQLWKIFDLARKAKNADSF